MLCPSCNKEIEFKKLPFTCPYCGNEAKYRDMNAEDFKAAVARGEKDFRLVRLPMSSDLRKLDISDAHLEWADLSGAHLEWAILSRAHLKRTCLFAAEMERARLVGAHLEEAILSQARLKKADFFAAHMEGANLIGAYMEKAMLRGAHLEGAILRFARMEGVALSDGAHLEKAELSYAHIEGADLDGAYLEGAVFYGAHMEGIDLSRTHNFDKANFANAFLNNAIINKIEIEIYRIWHYKYLKPLKYLFFFIFNIHEYLLFPFLWLIYNLRVRILSHDIKKPEPPKLPSKKVMDLTEVNGLDLTICADSVSKREIVDMQYIQQFEKKHPFIAFFWWLFSECGRNLTLWVMWSFLMAAGFGALFADHTCPNWLKRVEPTLIAINPQVAVDVGDNLKYFNKMPVSKDRDTGWSTPYYFSIVTFTTLGFGDVVPLNRAAEIWLAFEVILGYIMLGGLITILANKLARRS